MVSKLDDRHTEPTSIREDGPEHDTISLQYAMQCHPRWLSPCDHCLVGRYRDGSHVLRRLARHWKKENKRKGQIS